MTTIYPKLKLQRSTILVIVLLFSAMAMTLGQTQTFEQRKALFDYEKVGFDISVIKEIKRQDISIKEITFVGIKGKERVKAYLVKPQGNGPHAGILWGHWLGNHTSNKDQYLDEAVELASKGTVSLLFDAMWAKPKWYETRGLSNDYDSSIQQVIEMRRAMDLLMSQPNVDEDRVAYVGHDYSGMYGSIAAGVEPRALTYVFIAVTQSLYDWAFFANQPKSKVDYVQKMAVFELTDFIGQIDGSVFCQFSNTDPYISRTDGNVFYNAIKSRKERKRYDAEHFMGDDDIATDRKAWLIKELGLAK
jgi:cephalosporin-C deacetylase-like acetyl esterase